MHDRLYHAPGLWSLVRCTNEACKLLWLDPMPVAEDLHIAYQHYFTHTDGSAGATKRDLPAIIRGPLRVLRDAVLALGSIRRDARTLAFLALEDEPPGRVLEIGAGDGARLLRLRDRGWEAEGQEVDPRAKAFELQKEGVRIHLGPLEAIDLRPASYDAIVMNHVIEHVPSPVETLRTCARLLKPGGKLVAVTPNTAGLCARVYGSSWRELDPPRHLHLFDRNNLRAAAAMAGYAVIDVRTTGANGAGVALGSRYIRDTGRFSMESRSRSTLESAVVRLIQAAEGFVPGLGEECILQAWTAKPAE